MSGLTTDEAFSIWVFTKSRVDFSSAFLDFMFGGAAAVADASAHLLVSVRLWTVGQTVTRLPAVKTQHVALLVFLPLYPSVLSPLVFLQSDVHLLLKLLLSLPPSFISSRQRLSALLQILQEPVHVLILVVLFLTVGFMHSGAAGLSPSQMIPLSSVFNT